MSDLLQHAAWLLLAPEAAEEQRRQDLPLLFVFLGGFFLLLGFLDYLADGALNDGFSLLVLTAFMLLNASLYALPPHRRWATLGVRAALTLTFLAEITSLSRTFGGSFGHAWLREVLLLAAVLATLCTNYFLNHRGARRSRTTA